MKISTVKGIKNNKALKYNPFTAKTTHVDNNPGIDPETIIYKVDDDENYEEGETVTTPVKIDPEGTFSKLSATTKYLLTIFKFYHNIKGMLLTIQALIQEKY